MSADTHERERGPDKLTRQGNPATASTKEGKTKEIFFLFSERYRQRKSYTFQN